MNPARRFALAFALCSFTAVATSAASTPPVALATAQELEARADDLLAFAEATLDEAESCPNGDCPQRSEIEADIALVSQRLGQLHGDRDAIESLPPGSDLDSVIGSIDGVSAILDGVKDGWDGQG